MGKSRYIPERAKRYRQAYEQKYPGKLAESKQKFKKEHPEINRAMTYALRYIPLKDKCEWCGSTKNLHRHHPDYSKPLEVLTLCSFCHKDADRIRRRKIKQMSAAPIVHCDNCIKVYPDCGRGHPSYKGRGCSLGIPKPTDPVKELMKQGKC